MKIKIHKGFRAVLSVFVAVMLLVGVMPSQVWQGIKTDAAVVCTVYFARDMGSANLDGSSTWIYAEKDSNIIANYPEMVSVSDGSGFEIYKWEFSEQPTKIFFTSNYKNTNDITGDNIKNNYLYYTKEWKNGKAVVDSFPYSELTYTVLQPSQFSSAMNADVNVLTGGTFTKQAERHYVNVTLFDYFSDYELQHGTARTAIQSMYSSWEDPYRRMPLLTFDKALSEYYGGVNETHPLYFGDIHREWGGYDFSVYNAHQWSLYKTGSDYKQLYHDNNSMRRNETALAEADKAISDAAARGLYSNSLVTAYNENASNTTNAQRLKLASGNDAKWFNNTWLSGSNSTTKQLGASYDVEFPFWVEKHQRTFSGTSTKSNGTWAECNYFHINSEDPDHALRIRKDTNDQYYLEETGQGVYNFSGNDYYVQKGEASTLTTTYGFFPFNNKTDFYTNGTISNSGQSGDVHQDLGGLMDYRLRFDRTDYCFGMYMVIPFELNSMGTLYGTEDKSIDAPITFSFSGDDDLLVYVDGKLVLDIGGNHGKVQGEINFYEKKSWVSQFKSSAHNDGKKYLSTGEVAPSGTPDGDKVFGYFRRSATITDNLTQFTGCDGVDGHSFQGMTDLSNMTGVGGNKICSAGEHVMEIFYVERGLFDSNMEIMYNLPVKEERSFTVEEHIDTTTGVNDVFKNDSTFSTNASNLKLQIDVQFSEPTNGNDFTQLLESQDYPGDYPNKYTFTSTLYQNYFGTSDSVYTAKMGNSQTLTYVNDFIKPYDYNLKVSQNNSKIFIGDTDTGKTVNSLFTTTWTLAKYGSNSNENTGSGNDAGPVHTTSSSSRPARGTKTTSTSANNDTSFDFRGTTQNPDAIVFNNTMQTASLTINKTITGHTPTSDVTFQVTVTFDDVGGIALEDVRDSVGAVTTDRQIQMVVSVKVTANHTSGQATVSDIPVNTKYKIEETGTNNYTPSYTGTINTDWQILSSSDSASISNAYNAAPPTPTEITLQVQKIWADNTNIPQQVKFQLQYSTDGGSTWSNVTASGVTNGDVTLTSSTATVTNDGQRVVWTMEISNSSITDITSGGGDIKYRILEYGTDNTIITQTGTDYDENWKVNYNFALGEDTTIKPRNERLGNAKDANNKLLLAVLNTHPASNPTNPETGGNGIYIVIIGGFIAILLAGAGYFIYKKRIFA